MRDQITAAEYTNPDHTALVYTSIQDGNHHITRDGNPSFWNHVHQRAVLKSFDPNSHLGRQYKASPLPMMVDITPRLEPKALQPPYLQAPPQIVYKPDPELEARLDRMETYWAIEAAAEYAVLAMMPDGTVDAQKKADALHYLTQEAKTRNMDVAQLCRAIGQSRDERNKTIMTDRLSKVIHA